MVKYIIGNVIVFFLIIFCITAYASKIVITGKPVLLEWQRGYFKLPPSYTEKWGYHYVTIANMNRICYLVKKPELASLDTLQITIEDEGKKMMWNCYKFDDRFFELNF